MTAQADPYVRVYYRIIDDPKFETVFEDDRALATWLRLLLTADATYPAPAPIPDGIHRPTLNRLVKVGLIDLGTGRRYRMHGLSSERDKRSEQARNAANVRYGKTMSNASGVREQSVSNAAAFDDALHSAPLRTEPLQTDPRESRARANGLEKVGTILPDAIPIEGVDPSVVRLQKLAEELTGQAYVMNNVHSGYGYKAVQEQLNRHRFDAVERAWRSIANRAKAEGTSLPTLKQLVLGGDDILNPIPSSKDADNAAKQEEDRQRLAKREQAARDNLAYLRGEKR